MNTATLAMDDDDDEAPNVGKYDVLVSAEVAAAGRMGLAQGHRCCGGCCDMRRAVIIVDAVGIFICVFYAIYFAILATVVEETDSSTMDDATKQQVEGMMVQMEHVFLGLMAIKIPLNGLGIYGAMKFKHWPVAVALAAYVVEVIIDAVTFNIGGLLLAGFFAYPHVVFLREMKSGVMSELNYPTEKYSCCCV
eukprot:CAMPEP_0178477718 /NCGR_PEP_ID=MMETSP0696-20121128/4276_1 /TAXON_ID=265572 /ORGANISM="Extubocellulus spinifer, Strain CCMP396" /LENGTH=192 /DNA_ID=CAMNT_0020105039 /DNA_START=250 /DNA_END=828 /DNA_ORIENTATION=-